MTKGAVSSANGSSANANSGNHPGGNKGARNKPRRFNRSWNKQMFPMAGITTTSTPIDGAPDQGTFGTVSSSYEIGGCSSNSSTAGTGQEVICAYCMNSHPEFQPCYCEVDSGLYSTTADSLSPSFYTNYSHPNGASFYYPTAPQQPSNGGVYVMTGPEYEASSESTCYSDFESAHGIVLLYFNILFTFTLTKRFFAEVIIGGHKTPLYFLLVAINNMMCSYADVFIT